LNRLKQSGLPIAFVTSFLAVGVPYWLIPYGKLNLPDALIAPGLLVVGLAASALRSCAAAPFWKITCIVAAAVPAAVFARVIVDGAKDPTSHNLWPLEIIIALPIGFGCALAGTLAGMLVAKAFTRGGDDQA
jgi:hypothetical protein